MKKKDDLKTLVDAVRQAKQAQTDEEKAVAFDAVAKAAKPKPLSEAEKFKRMLSNDSE